MNIYRQGSASVVRKKKKNIIMGLFFDSLSIETELIIVGSLVGVALLACIATYLFKIGYCVWFVVNKIVECIRRDGSTYDRVNI